MRKIITGTILLSSSFLAQAADGSLVSPYTTLDCQSKELCPSGVYLFKETDDQALIQKTIDAIYTSFLNEKGQAVYTSEAEWSKNRFALLFQPGNYPNVKLKVNYYTQILGLGENPNQVNLNTVYVDNFCLPGSIQSCLTMGALNNFWRGLENVTLKPTDCPISKDPENGLNNDKCVVWNVSQAAPLRKVNIEGDLMLGLAGCFNFEGQCNPPNGKTPQYPSCRGDYNKDWVCGAGYASGGYLANGNISGDVHSFGQQQWFTRNSQFTKWDGGVWNMVFLQTQGQLPQKSPNTGQTPNMTDTENWPVFAISASAFPKNVQLKEKPYLFSKDNNWMVMNPGATPSSGESSTLSDFVVMNKSNQDVGTINQALSGKKGLIIEPGIYQLDKPIVVPENRVVLGIGLPNLVCNQGSSCLEISGKNTKVAGIMFSAGYTQSNTLVNVTKTLGNASNTGEATYLYDMFCRIAEDNSQRQGNGPTAKNCVNISTDYTVGDNLWLWRADHDKASSKVSADPSQSLVTADQNVSEHGLYVTGNNVTMLGLFSEHHLGSNVYWKGDYGQTYFYQSELAYTPPNDWQCQDFENGETGGCPSYYIDKNVQHHYGLGLATYTFFQNNTNVTSAIKAPAADGIELHQLVGRYLNAYPQLVTESGFTCMVSDYMGQCYGAGASHGQGVDDPLRLPALGLYTPIKK
jgi:hypothetical protein